MTEMKRRDLDTRNQRADALKGYQDAMKETRSHERDDTNRFHSREILLLYFFITILATTKTN